MVYVLWCDEGCYDAGLAGFGGIYSTVELAQSAAVHLSDVSGEWREVEPGYWEPFHSDPDVFVTTEQVDPQPDEPDNEQVAHATATPR